MCLQRRKKISSVQDTELHSGLQKQSVLGAANPFRPLIAGTGYHITTGSFIQHETWDWPLLSSGSLEEETSHMTQGACLASAAKLNKSPERRQTSGQH